MSLYNTNNPPRPSQAPNYSGYPNTPPPPGIPQPPKPPKMANSKIIKYGRTVGQSVYNKKLGGYITNTYGTPEEQAIEKNSTAGISNIMGQLSSAVNLSPEGIAGYRDAFAAPQMRALNDSYNQGLGQANMAASGSGARNSVGFSRYLADNIERNRANGLADIQANAKMMEYDLPNKIMTPFQNQFNLYSAALGGQQANNNQNLNSAMSGGINSQNAVNQNYQNQMNYWQAFVNQQNQQPKRNGLFNFFSGGS